MRKPTVSRLISIGVAVLCLAVPANTLVQPVAAAARGFFELSTTVPRTISPVGQNDYIFRTVRVEIDYRGGPVRLSSTTDGSGSIVTDDSMTLNVEKLKGKRSLTIDFSRNCVGLERRPPQDITNLFRRGVNKVTLLLRDRCGVAYSSDPYFLVGDLWARNLLIEDQLGRGRNPGTFGDPVNTSIGNFHREETDLAFSTSVYGMDLVRTYNALDDEVGALGQGWSTSFEATLLDEDGGAVSFRDTDARTVIFTPEGPGFRRPAQFFADLGQNGDGTRTIEWPGQESWRFDSQGRLVEKRNWDGQTVRIAFTDDRLTSVAGPSGTGITFAYDASGRLTSAASSDGRRVAYGYGPGGLLETVIDVTGATTSYGYDDNGRLRSVRDADGKDRVSVTYDAGGRVAKQVNADGGTASFSYDQGASATTVEDGSTHTSLRYRHDPAGQLLELTDPFGAASSRSYDGEGNLASAARRGGGGVEQTFDTHGNVLTRTIGGATVTFAYDSLDRAVSSTDAGGAVTRYTYDGSSRVLASRQDPTGGVTRFESTAGRITAVTDPDGVATHFGYDSAATSPP
jgi:YD repeat-containing protein